MNGFISLNQLAYGQATIEERMLIDSGTQFEKHVKVFQNDPYPENVSTEAKQEIYEIVSKVKELNIEDWRERCFFIDSHLGEYLNLVAKKAGMSQFQSLFNQVNKLYLTSLVFQTKYYYNRLRPNQLAYYLGISLSSGDSRTGHTPSYPSGHTLQAHFFTKLISDVMNTPWEAEPVLEVEASRMSMGVHFRSDNDFAIKMSEYLLTTDEYKELVENIRKQIK